jgi:hypothetical protein
LLRISKLNYCAGFNIPKKAKIAIRRIQTRGIIIPAIAIFLPAKFSVLILRRETIPNMIAKAHKASPSPKIDIVKNEIIPRTNEVIADLDVSTI